MKEPHWAWCLRRCLHWVSADRSGSGFVDLDADCVLYGAIELSP